MSPHGDIEEQHVSVDNILYIPLIFFGIQFRPSDIHHDAPFQACVLGDATYILFAVTMPFSWYHIDTRLSRILYASMIL